MGLSPSTVVAGVVGLGRWVVKELPPLCTIIVTPLAKREKNAVEDSQNFQRLYLKIQSDTSLFQSRSHCERRNLKAGKRKGQFREPGRTLVVERAPASEKRELEFFDR